MQATPAPRDSGRRVVERSALGAPTHPCGQLERNQRHRPGLYRFGDLWIALGEGPAFDDYTSGSGRYAEQALRRLSDRLRERRGSVSG